MSNKTGYTIVSILPDMIGLNIADKDLIDGLLHWIGPPPWIRYVEHGSCETTDARPGRVTIRHYHGIITCVEQEVMVALPEHLNNGHEFTIALNERKKKNEKLVLEFPESIRKRR